MVETIYDGQRKIGEALLRRKANEALKENEAYFWPAFEQYAVASPTWQPMGVSFESTGNSCFFADVWKLKLVRHLHDDMGLELKVVGLVPRYREPVRRLQHRLADLQPMKAQY